MKTGTTTTLLALALLLTGAPLCAQETRSIVEQSPDSHQTPSEDWSDTVAAEKRLVTAVRQRIKGIDKESIEAFLTDPQNRLLLAQWHFMHVENAQDTAALEKRREELRRNFERAEEAYQSLRTELGTLKGELPKGLEQRLALRFAERNAAKEDWDSPRLLREVLANPAGAEFFNTLFNDVEWLEQMLYSGEFAAPGRAVAILAALAEKDKSILSAGMPRTIATATALEWAKYGWGFRQALDRAHFYIANDRDNRFHSGFRNLPFWQMRVVCGCKGDNPNGSVESLAWALDNVHLPADQYSGACWQASYLLNNLFGDTIHGSHYYAVYDDVYGNNAVQRTRDVGGVCGSLSHFGAFAALGNGVPALTMGEPGHCSYVVCVQGKWVPAYSLTWQRGLHWQAWRGVHVYASLPMATELYGAEQKQNTALSAACRSLGNLFEAEGLRGTALNCLRAAVKVQPLNYPAWRDYAELVKTHYADKPKTWGMLNSELSRYLAPRYPEMAAELLRKQIYPHIKGLSAKQLTPMFTTFWRSVEGLGPDRWDIEALCNAQMELLKGKLDSPSSEQVAATANRLYGLILQRTASKSAYATSILAWGNALSANMDTKAQKAFMRTTFTALSKGSKNDEDAAARDRMLGQAMLGAANMRDRSSFQALAKLLSPTYRQPQNKLPQWEPFPGKLVSQGGLLYTSSTCGHDDPAAHWGVLEPVGGRFHTGQDKDAWAVVQLPKPAILSGVVTIAPNGNLWRLPGMKVQYSESGRDDDWQDAGDLPNPTGASVNRLDLQDKKLRARYIRILRPGGPQFFHLFGIYVYGKPAA